MSSTRTVTNIAITLAAVAMLSVAGCKKEPTTPPPDGDTAASDDDGGDDVESPSDGGDEPEAAAALDKSNFDETINEHFSEVSDCYVAALEGNPKLEGTLHAEFKIGTEGQVVSISALDDSTLKDEGLLACINQAAAGWSFARPAGGEMTLRYPYKLAPG
jgi:hypothetical protein